MVMAAGTQHHQVARFPLVSHFEFPHRRCRGLSLSHSCLYYPQCPSGEVLCGNPRVP